MLVSTPIEDFDGSCPACGASDAMYAPAGHDFSTDGVELEVRCDCGFSWSELFPACVAVQWDAEALERAQGCPPE